MIENVELLAYAVLQTDGIEFVGRVVDFDERKMTIEKIAENDTEIDEKLHVIENFLMENKIIRRAIYKSLNGGRYYDEKEQKWISFDRKKFPIDKYRIHAFPSEERGFAFLYQVFPDEVYAVGRIVDVGNNTIDYQSIGVFKNEIEEILAEKFPEKEISIKKDVSRYGDSISQLELGSRYRVLWI
jgi:hypothetical protein